MVIGSSGVSVAILCLAEARSYERCTRRVLHSSGYVRAD